MHGVYHFEKASLFIKRENKIGLQISPKHTINVVSHLSLRFTSNSNAIVHAFNAMVQFSIDSIFLKKKQKRILF